MISYWKLDETSGSVYDDYVGTNNATSTNTPTPAAPLRKSNHICWKI
jgi:hypothetical protein